MMKRAALLLVLAALAAGPAPASGQTGDAPQVVRHAGADRYATAAAVSAATFPAGVDTVYVATGEGFADALAGGALAAVQSAPILLVARDRVPDATAAELRRLAPGRIVVFGGPEAVADAVLADLGELTTGGVTRLAGDSRYATAAAISGAGFEPGVTAVLVATGEGFADALAGGARRGRAGCPDPPGQPRWAAGDTAAELSRLAPDRIDVLGGAAAVSDEVLAALEEHAPRVRRLAGPDRYETAADIAEDAFPGTADTVFLATGEGFADALAGVPAAALAEAPVLLTRTACLPVAIGAQLARLAPDRVVVLGGVAAVSEPAARLVACETVPLPTFAVDADLQPAAQSAPPLEDGLPRPLARVADEDGNALDFVQDELLVVADDRDELDAVLARWHGSVLDEAGFEGHHTTYLVRVDPMAADADGLAADVRALDPAANGAMGVSSEEGLALLAAAASEASAGMQVGVGAIAEPQQAVYADGVVTEAASGFPGYSPNAFTWPHLGTGPGTQDFTVTNAWRLLEAGGRLGERVGIRVIDAGFAASNPDFPGSFSGDGQRNTTACSGGGTCPWHGTHVALTAAGNADNGAGVVGSGAPVATLAASSGYSMFDAIDGLAAAVATGQRIVNTSFTSTYPAGTGWSASPLDAATAAAREFGVLVVAGAGNDGQDVDAESCSWGVCWESGYRVPCEAPVCSAWEGWRPARACATVTARTDWKTAAASSATSSSSGPTRSTPPATRTTPPTPCARPAARASPRPSSRASPRWCGPRTRRCQPTTSMTCCSTARRPRPTPA